MTTSLVETSAEHSGELQEVYEEAPVEQLCCGEERVEQRGYGEQQPKVLEEEEVEVASWLFAVEALDSGAEVLKC